MSGLQRIGSVALLLTCVFHALPARADDVRAAVEAGNRAFIAAFLRGDAAAVAALYTPDAQVIAPGAPVASGRTAIAAFWQGSIDAGTRDVALTTLDVESAGDLASETGTVRLVAKDGAVSQARYVVVWKKSDGTWRLHRDIWNAAN
jgi:uncharacterized protein (TIGR02246 family)